MNQILKSTIDKRIYKSIQLKNKLICLLISDQETEKSAAALNVDVGTLEDPIDRQGLAHFCEHMLFMGTTKYPQESEYQDFISKNSGQTNAFTSELNTNFHFSVANNALHGALDRFAQFFISPLFSDSCTEREMKAVDSEFNMNLQNDFWRKFQIFHSLSAPDSLYNKFMIGNLKTLQHPDTRDRLLEFHQKYYSANLMRLVVYGSQPIEELETWTKELFEDIPNKDLPSPAYKQVPFAKDNLGKFVRIVPIKNQDYLEIKWVTDFLQPHYRSCPGKYISHLLGHEGENSLLSLLIKEDLAQELSCGSSSYMKCFSVVEVNIKLTKKGLKNYQLILQYVLQYVNMLNQEGTQRWVFDEIRKVKQLEFDYLEKQNPFNFVTSLANRLQLYPVEEVLKAPYLMEEFDETLVRKTISSLTPDNIVVFLSSQELKGQLGEFEHHFGTEYKAESFSDELKHILQVKDRHAQLRLPPVNNYMPQTTETLQADRAQLPKFPQKVYDTPQTEIYFKQDNQFGVPKAVIQLRIYTNGLGYGRQPLTEVLARLWISILKNHTRELNYLAEMAKIEPSISLAMNGVEISIHGFSDSMHRFVIDLFRKIVEFRVEDYANQFESNLLKIRQELENFKRQPPYQQVHSIMYLLLREGSAFEHDELIRQTHLVSIEDLIMFNRQFLKQCRFDWLISGNLLKEQAIKIGMVAEEVFKAAVLPTDLIHQIRALHLPKDVVHNYSYNLLEPTETNSGIALHYQFEVGTLRFQLIGDILANIVKSPFFSQLRTVEQLGYAVFSQTFDIRGIAGFNFLIQSNTKCPNYVQDRVRLFVRENFTKIMNEMTEEKFQEFKRSVEVALLEKDYSLNREAARQWLELMKHQNMFDKKERQLEILPTITLQETKEFFNKYFIEEPRQLEVHAISPTHVEEQKAIPSTSRVSHSIEWIKRRLPLYPDYYSML